MINHARTLLLNKPGNARPDPTFFLEAYVDSKFSPLALPGNLAPIYETLIGVNSDDAYANYMLWLYMHVLHSTEFASYVLALDKRVTYLRDLNALPLFQPPQYVKVGGTTGDLYFQGVIAPGKILQNDWRVEVLPGNLARSTELRTNRAIVTPFTVQEGLSSAVEMYGQSSFAVLLNPEPDAEWLVTSFTPPASSLVSIYEQLRELGPEVVHSLFLGSSPYNTFQQLWNKHADIHYSLSGFLLAYIYRVDEVRRHG